MSLSLTIRFRGGSYRVCGAPHRPKSRRWLRNFLCMRAPSGVFPLPVALWLTFPDLGILTSEQLGAARAFILDRVKPGYFHEKEMWMVSGLSILMMVTRLWNAWFQNQFG